VATAKLNHIYYFLFLAFQPMLKQIRMPYVVRGLCGATIGFLVGLYIVNTFFGGRVNFVVLIAVVLGAAAGVYFFRR
jgi:CBS-domain-containing membrane protein